MKFNKKKIFTLALAICLIAILSFSTLAWFSDADSVKNEFHIATSDDPADPDDIFSVDVWEEVPDGDDEDEDPDEVGKGSAEDVTDNGEVYEDILPGDKLLKTVHVANTGAYDQFIRVKVTVDDASIWKALLAKYQITDLGTIFGGHDETKWTVGEITEDTTADTITYVYYLNEKLLAATDTAAAGDVVLFETVNIPTAFTDEDMAAFTHGVFTLDVVAEAVQTENLGDGVDTAQEAFAVVTADQTI